MPVILSKKNRAVLAPATTGVRTLFPSEPTLLVGNDTYVALHHNLANTKLLRHLGYTVPNPMMIYFDWRGGTPFEVQRQTCALLTENPRAYVLNHMGTGKTKAALWAWEYLYSQGIAGKLLVVAPLSTLNFVWAREAFATLPHRKVAVLHGSRDRRLERLASDADIFVVNHDGLRVISDALATKREIGVLCLDELAVYRNNSDRSKLMRKFSARFDYVWGLSGAPMPNAPTDVWAQCRIVTPQSVPRYFSHARDMLMTKISNFKWVPKPDAVENAFKMMQPAVRYALDDVVELPELVTRTIDVEMTPDQAHVYKTLMEQMASMVQGKQITALNAGVAMGKLLQIASGWVYTGKTAVAGGLPEFVPLDCKPRVSTLLDLINSANEKVLVFAPFRHTIDGLSQELTKQTISHCVIHGGTTDRDKLFNLFQNTEKYKVLLGHPECFAHGVTLTAADTAIWYAPITSLETYEQANARIRRVGQKHRQQILHIQASDVEKRIYSLLRSKQKVQERLLEMFEAATAANGDEQ